MSEDMSNEKDTIQTLYRALLEPVSEVDSMSSEEVRAYLLAEGLDPAKLRAALTQRLKEVEGRLRLQKASADYKAVALQMAKVGTRIAAAVGDTKEAVIQRLTSLQARQPAMAAAMFRKFEQADDVDFKALYEDLLRLDAMGGDDPNPE